jgi:hypothetical protein
MNPTDLIGFVMQMTPSEATAFIIFLVSTIGFFLWVVWLVIRR